MAGKIRKAARKYRKIGNISAQLASIRESSKHQESRYIRESNSSKKNTMESILVGNLFMVSQIQSNEAIGMQKAQKYQCSPASSLLWMHWSSLKDGVRSENEQERLLENLFFFFLFEKMLQWAYLNHESVKVEYSKRSSNFTHFL